MTDLNLHELALEFCAQRRECDVASIEAAMRLGALAATERATDLFRETREALNKIRTKSNQPD